MIAISLALPSTLLLTLDNLQCCRGGSGPISPQLSVLLTGDSELPVAEQLQRILKSWPEIDDVVLLDRELALSQFIQTDRVGDSCGVAGTQPVTPYVNRDAGGPPCRRPR